MSETQSATKPARGPRLRVAHLPAPRLRRPDTILLIVDVQDRLLSAMPDAENLVARCVLLARMARELEIPILITEQNPTRLGATCEALRQVCDDEAAAANTIAKMQFSAVIGETAQSIETSQRPTILLCGIEAHVCVLQSALDLRERGHNVFAAVDAIGSRRESDKTIALERMKSVGVTFCTAESALFELLGSAEHPAFKTLLPFVK